MPKINLTIKIATRFNLIMKWIALSILYIITIQYQIACFFLNRMAEYKVGSFSSFKNLKMGDNIEMTLRCKKKDKKWIRAKNI